MLLRSTAQQLEPLLQGGETVSLLEDPLGGGHGRVREHPIAQCDVLLPKPLDLVRLAGRTRIRTDVSVDLLAHDSSPSSLLGRPPHMIRALALSPFQRAHT